jgi:seryl-tRNA synthetase
MSKVSGQYGFTPIMTPDIIFTSMAEACGFQPRGEHTQVYSIKNDDLVLVGTQEIPLAALYYNKTVNEEELPIKMVAFGHCFRAEAGTCRVCFGT